MKRCTTPIAALAVALFATGGFALAGHGHHGHHGHGHHHHSGFRISIGHGLRYGHFRGHYGHHHHYPSYFRSYSYFPRYYSYYRSYRYYPSYRTYSYYRSPTYCSPSVIYRQPPVRTYSPAQPLEQPPPKPEVGPTPPSVPDARPNAGPAPQGGSPVRFTTLVRSESEVQPTAARTSPATPPSDGLGPQLGSQALRRVMSDDEAPWVVPDATRHTPATTGRIAGSESTAPR